VVPLGAPSQLKWFAIAGVGHPLKLPGMETKNTEVRHFSIVEIDPKRMVFFVSQWKAQPAINF
jgi:hypothetical protein